MLFIITILNIAATLRTTNLSNTFDQFHFSFSPISGSFPSQDEQTRPDVIDAAAVAVCLGHFESKR